MGYNDYVSRSDNAANVTEVIDTMLRKNLPTVSAALQIFPIVPMSKSQATMPVVAGLPQAFWVNGDTGLKQTTDMQWDKKVIYAEELAAIVPVPEAVLADSEFDIFANVQPNLEAAVARAIDNAIFFGVNKPSTWPAAIAVGAASASNTVTRGTANAAAGGIAGDFSNLFSKVEEDGYEANFVLSNVAYKGYLRNARDADGNHQNDVSPTNVYGVDVLYPMRGLWPTGSGAVTAITGDRTQGIIGLRQDFDYKFLDQAVITDNNGNIIFNLPQQDMVALRITFRLGWQIANTLNYDQPVEANRYPFATMLES